MIHALVSVAFYLHRPCHQSKNNKSHPIAIDNHVWLEWRTNCLTTHPNVILLDNSKDINNKMILVRPQQFFVSKVHTLFYSSWWLQMSVKWIIGMSKCYVSTRNMKFMSFDITFCLPRYWQPVSLTYPSLVPYICVSELDQHALI